MKLQTLVISAASVAWLASTAVSAKQEDEYAQFNVASLLLEKNKVKQAHYWFNQEAKNNHSGAQEALKKLGEVYVK